MKKCAVMQPSYLPWVGFFNLILNSDVFIFLDDVQYSKNSFFNRNKYPANNKDGFAWLTVPVRRVKSDQLFLESKLVEEENWRKKHLLTIRHAYSRMKYFEDVFPVLEKEISDTDNDTLSKLNISLVRGICKYLSIEKEFYISSELKVEGNRSERLDRFCSMFHCTTYLSPGGAKEYIDQDDVLPKSDKSIIYQIYTCKEYDQAGESFKPQMSIIDLLFRFSPKVVLDIIYSEIA